MLQWVGGHETLLPRLMGQLAPGGVLAVQMPDNLDEPSHRLMRETAKDGPWAGALGDAASIRERILSAGAYHDLLVPHAASVDIWRTTYYHPLDGPEAIVTWLSSTGLRPFLDPLDDSQRAGFLAAYLERDRRGLSAAGRRQGAAGLSPPVHRRDPADRLTSQFVCDR